MSPRTPEISGFLRPAGILPVIYILAEKDFITNKKIKNCPFILVYVCAWQQISVFTGMMIVCKDGFKMIKLNYFVCILLSWVRAWQSLLRK